MPVNSAVPGSEGDPQDMATHLDEVNGEKATEVTTTATAGISVLRGSSQTSQDAMESQEQAQGGLKREFKARHMAMISIGGVL